MAPEYVVPCTSKFFPDSWVNFVAFMDCGTSSSKPYSGIQGRRTVRWVYTPVDDISMLCMLSRRFPAFDSSPLAMS